MKNYYARRWYRFIMLNKYDIDNNKMTKAKSERVDKQYYIDFRVTQTETNQSIKIAEEFIAEIHKRSLNNSIFYQTSRRKV